MSARTAIRNWVTADLRSQFIWSIVGSVVCVFVGLVGLYLLYWIVFFVSWRVFGDLLTTGQSLQIFTLILIGLLFAAYFLVDFRKLEQMDFDQKGSLYSARAAALITGNPFLTLAAGPRTAFSSLKVVLICMLAVPGLLGLSVQLLNRAYRLSLVHAGDVGRALLIAVRADQRVSLEQAFATSKTLTPQQLRAQLKLVEGVIFRDDPPPGMYLTDGLRNKLVHAATVAKEARSSDADTEE